jgi:anti-anti-sigma factor
MEVRKQGDVVVMRLSAQDLSKPQDTSEVLEQLIKMDGERKFVADLTGLSYLTSLQCGTIVTLHLLCYENLAVMKLAGVSEKAKVVLRLIGLDQLMEIHHGAEVAKASFGASTPSNTPPTTPGTPLANQQQAKPRQRPAR